ncbi:hypothetical protein Aperf_G00000124585 [Anoplocephala perfoliata]
MDGCLQGDIVYLCFAIATKNTLQFSVDHIPLYLSDLDERRLRDICIRLGLSDVASNNIFVVKSTDSIGHLRRHAIIQSFENVKEALNFGLYLPSQGNKKGKFLEDERPIADYPVLLQGGGRRSRDVDDATSTSTSTMVNGMQNSPDSGVGQDPCWLEVTQNFFMEMVRNKDVKGIENLLAKGFDPNFLSRRDGEAPITLAATVFNPRNVIIALVDGGAHIDFRAQDSHTALHRAAICGNYEAIQTLLDLGQNPNCRDSHGLTPLYHAVSTDFSARCTQALLYDHAIIGVEDDQGYQEIHQACKANRLQHLENLITYGADLNARTRRGQTPLHVCVWNEADDCLRQLLIRGADPSELNDDNQTPLEFALLTNHNEQADILRNFDPADIVAIKETPSYNTSRRATVNGPRGAVTYNMLHKSSIYCADSASICPAIISSPESLFSADQIPISNFGVTASPVPSINQNGTADDMSNKAMQSPYSHAMDDYSGIHGGTPRVRRSDFGIGRAMQRLPPLPNTPSNQYFSSVVPGGPADRAGVKEGDYVIEIDGHDVTDACHEEAVDCIASCGNSLIMRVTSVYRGSGLRQVNRRSSISHAPLAARRLLKSEEMHELSETCSSISSSSENDREINYTPKTTIPVSKPPPGLRRWGSRERMPLMTERRSRSRDRQSRASKNRTQSLSRLNDQLFLQSTSPAARTKDKVFVFEKIDGKTRAVPFEESKMKNQGQRSRSRVQFAGDHSPSPKLNRRSLSSDSIAILVMGKSYLSAKKREMISDIEVASFRKANPTADAVEHPRNDDEEPLTTRVSDNNNFYQNIPLNITRPYRSCLAIGPLERTDQDDETNFVKKARFRDDQSINQRSISQTRLPRTKIAGSMPRLDQI